MGDKVRKTGLQRPFHVFQITSWLMQVINIVIFFSVTLACLNKETRLPIGIIFVIMQILTIFLGYKLSASDPTDEIVVLYKKNKDNEYSIFSISANLENNCEKYCNYCRSPVDLSSKHCVRCNRCTLKFDHHCKWVNNCIGLKNYKVFICLINVCFLFEVFLGVLSGWIMVDGINNQENFMKNARDFYDFRVFELFISTQAFILIEGGLFAGLLLYLIILHIFLYFKGQTTYEFIMNVRGKKVVPKDKRSDTNSVLNNSNFQAKDDAHKSLSKSDLELKHSARDLYN